MTPKERIANFKRRALLVRRAVVNPKQMDLRAKRERVEKLEAKAANRADTAAKISAAMKESWARRKREAGIVDYDDGTEHAGSPDSDLEKLDMLLGGEE